ncbi:MAG TPA: hypothetical protein VI749_03175 [Candidatus Omnitrophota bacterium]|nr:hypothetical protein [Candidatus Omnitrophota bacterium]
MYYLGKILQAFGLTIILIGFIQEFPELMSHRSLLVGLLIFSCGWLVDRYLLKK